MAVPPPCWAAAATIARADAGGNPGGAGPRLEARVDAEPAHHRGAHDVEAVGGNEELVKGRVDDLEVEGGIEPLRDREVVYILQLSSLSRPRWSHWRRKGTK